MVTALLVALVGCTSADFAVPPSVEGDDSSVDSSVDVAIDEGASETLADSSVAVDSAIDSTHDSAIDSAIDSALDSALDGGGGDAIASDSIVVSDVVATGFCATLSSPHTFCADFDEGGPVEGGWSRGVSARGLLTTSSVSKTAPSGALGSIEARRIGTGSGLGGPAYAALVRSLAAGVTHIAFETDLRIVPYSFHLDDTGAVSLIAFGPEVGTGGVALVVGRAGFSVVVATSGAVSSYPIPSGITDSTWLRVHVDVTLSSSGAGSVDVTVDGKSVLSQRSLNTADSDPTGLTYDVTVGPSAFGTNPTPPMAMTVDDVWINTTR